MLGLVGTATLAAPAEETGRRLLAAGPSEPEWFDRVIVLPSAKVLLCTAEKNGLTEINKLAATVMGQPHRWFQFSPAHQGLDFATFQQYLRDSSWRKAVFYRDPMERFLSAYLSKCLRA